MVGPLAHRLNAHSSSSSSGGGRRGRALLGRTQASPIVYYLGKERAVGDTYSHPDVFGLRVSAGVGQGLPYDAQDLPARLPKRSLQDPVVYVESYVQVGSHCAL